MRLRSKVCIAGVTLHLPFTSICNPTSKPELSVLSECKYVVGKERVEVVGVGVSAAVTELVDWENQKQLGCCRTHFGSWRNTAAGNRFCSMLAPAWSRHTVLQPAQLALSMWQRGPKRASFKPPWGSSFTSESHLLYMGKVGPCTHSTLLAPILACLASILLSHCLSVDFPSKKWMGGRGGRPWCPLAKCYSWMTNKCLPCSAPLLNGSWASIRAETCHHCGTHWNLIQWKPQVLILRMFSCLAATDRSNPLFRSLMVPGEAPCKQPLFLLGGSDAK